jgi:hypothetical protein
VTPGGVVLGGSVVENSSHAIILYRPSNPRKLPFESVTNCRLMDDPETKVILTIKINK